MAKQSRVTTPEGKLSYPNLFEPKAFEQQEPRYGCEILLDGNADLSAVKAACAEILNRQFPDIGNRPKIPLPIHSGDKENEKRQSQGKDPRKEIAGKWIIKARCKQKPSLVDENCQPIMDQSKLYAGCVVRINVTPFWFDKGVNRGISFALNGVQFVKDGEPFGNPFDAAAAFGPVKKAGGSASLDDDAMFA